MNDGNTLFASNNMRSGVVVSLKTQQGSIKGFLDPSTGKGDPSAAAKVAKKKVSKKKTATRR